VLHISNWWVEAFFGRLVVTGLHLAPLWQRGLPMWGVWRAADSALPGGLIFCLWISTSHITYCASYIAIGINFIHVINIYNVQNVLHISVMYVMSKVRIFVQEGWVWNGSCLGYSKVYR